MKYKSNTPAIIMFETYGERYTWQTDHSDLTASEVIGVFKKLLVAQGFNEKDVLEEMRNYSEEALEMYECDTCFCTELPEDDITIHHTVLQTKNTNDKND